MFGLRNLFARKKKQGNQDVFNKKEVSETISAYENDDELKVNQPADFVGDPNNKSQDNAEVLKQVTSVTSSWSEVGDKLENVDPLLDCLVILSKHYNNPYTADGISAGLPVSKEGMTPELFARAAKKVGFVARFVKRPLDKISGVLMPAVLLLHDKKACVLLGVDKERGVAKILLPESGEGEVDLSIDELLSLYSGYCFFVRPQFKFDKRSQLEEGKSTNKHWFWGTIVSSWRIYRDVFIASLLINIFALVSPLFIMNVYDRVVPNNAFETLWVLAAGVTVVYVFDFLLRTLRSYFIDIAGKKSDILLSSNIFSKVNNITMASRPRSVGAFAKNLQDFDSIRDFITSASITTLVDIPFMFLIVGVIYLIGGPLGFVPIVTILLVFLYSLIIQKPLRHSIEEGQKTSVQKNAVLIESLSNAESVKINNAQGTLQHQWEQAVGNIADWGLKTRQLAQSCSSFAMVAQQMTTVVMVIVGVYMISEREMSMGALVACVMLTGRALAPMAQFAALAARYNHAKTAFKGLSEIMDSPVEQPDDVKFVHRPKFDGSFEFEDVSFSYPDQEQNAITNINLKIKAGEKVGIIGRIGSGKSTVGKLMMGLYGPSDGAVRIDGIDLRQINPVDLRRNVGAVSQDVTLFYGSIKENICFGVPYVEDEAIIRASDLSGVSEFANKKPSGLDSIVGERGHHLSGGQRQSVAISRALLFDPNILVLDEPTASMDNTTETRMRRRLDKIMGDKTLILITHKSSMLDLVDRLIVMDSGRILADGPKEHVFEALRQGKLKVS
ncbi:Toxin RTX-I translocation ATP-binding protein [Marinomonas gallaica]|uniref:Toxin RTX-I translocation ATP-binding protein n=1 Tax=Marinomonas gallaica TaxID=1806667 RepID=A0A1C3JSQ0_9GAMM|nr:Toxin RTX-I translocation ATP-binding protein [Marinomonas gallaica]SBT22294.1 Toxin RTX-I translocation ATP-binding protein [Marinomonas gallaica]